MTNREKFIEEIDTLIEKFNVSLSIEANTYFAELKDGKASVGGLTETGKAILEWLNEDARVNAYFSAKSIGEGLFASSRVISGAARKLVTDGYLEKEGKNPVTYKITTSGRQVLSTVELS